MIKVIVIGGGGHARVIIDTLLLNSKVKLLGYTDKIHHSENILGVPFLGDDSFIEKQNPKDIQLVLGIGTIKSSLLRKNIYEKWFKKGFYFFTVIHPSAIISKNAKIFEGGQILMGSIIQVGVEIGINSIVNTGAQIDHDCKIADHVHIAPGVTLSGGVLVGECSHLGSGCIVIQAIKIGSYATIAAGAVVTTDINENACVRGIPAK